MRRHESTMMDQVLVERLMGENRGAIDETLELIQRQYGKMVAHFLRRQFPEAQMKDIDEVMHEAIERLWKTRESLKDLKGRLSSGLCRIAWEHMYDRIRAEKALKRGGHAVLVGLEDDVAQAKEEDPSEACERNEVEKAVARFMENLEDELDHDILQTLLTSYGTDQDDRILAERHGKSRNAVAARRRRLRLDLQEYLRKKGLIE